MNTTTKTLHFSDIFKSSFIEKIGSISALDMVIALGLAFILGLFIMTVYKKTFKGVMYSSSFGVALMSLTLITTLIILAVTSNVVLSLGMVGALSIVRFRSAIKEPIEIAFLFWAISGGIVLGAGLIPLAIFGSIFIGIVMVLFVNKKSNETPYIMVINYEDDNSEKDVLAVVNKKVPKYLIKSKTASRHNGIELTVEIRLKEATTDFLNELSKIEGVSNVVMVSYNGDYMG
ncbi:DUF4956 domain-containing protein [Tissierella sp. MSJ-40]|jgi:uncharacterized membrane protein YhiD involved in acid resistance|uniref:DUF4956 domain-containing protein n=1 Tax=Tissierella simiarum TaxID=2841534 RepID=A0ABS6E4T6_9FIRM|nr:DUF4956 domain-containing protein [Tissierella simiarum]MBU5437924.1 DUF4956 domain-containing protein [Tissierella simiarum]